MVLARAALDLLNYSFMSAVVNLGKYDNSDSIVARLGGSDGYG
jgi:hypothetical protein